MSLRCALALLALMLCASTPRVIPLPPPPDAASLPSADEPLPPGATARCGTTRWRHPSAIRALAYSPDSKLLATLCDAGVYLWQADSGRLVRRWPERDTRSPHRDYSLHFAPDGSTLTVLGDP